MAKKKTFEENIQRLDTILIDIEDTNVTMSETIKLYKEGLDLVVNCSAELNAFEQKITELKIKAEDSLQS